MPKIRKVSYLIHASLLSLFKILPDVLCYIENLALLIISYNRCYCLPKSWFPVK